MLIVWKKVAGCDDQIPEPQRGLDTNFDEMNDRVNAIKKELELYLDEAKAIIQRTNGCKSLNLLG